MKKFSSRGCFISLASVLTLLLISFVFYGCGWTDGNSSTAWGGDEEKTFFLISDTDSLTRYYQDRSIGTAVGVCFNKSIDAGEEPERTPSGTSQFLKMFPLGGPALISVFEKETQKKIEGTLYLSFGGRRLTFVPAGMLTPDTCYTVLISSVARSVDGEYLGDDYLFEVSTNGIGKVIAVAADSDDVMEGDYLSLSAETYIDFTDMEWNFGGAQVLSQEPDDGGADCTFDTPGVYEIKLDAEDRYGRTFTATREIRVFPDIANALNEQGEFVDVTHVPQGDMIDDTLTELLGEFGEDILATVTADLPLSTVTHQRSRVPMEEVPERLSEVLPGKPLVSVSIKPERTAGFGSDYVERLIEAERFLGIVSFKGFPAILSYTPLDGYSVLEMLVCEGDIAIRYSDRTCDIDLTMTGMKPTPAVHRVLIPISDEVLGNFQVNLPGEIRRPLSVLYTKTDRKTERLSTGSIPTRRRYGIPPKALPVMAGGASEAVSISVLLR